jgi:hypothetical protein
MTGIMSEPFVSVTESRVVPERLSDGIRIVVPRRRTFWQFLIPAWALFIVGFGAVSMFSWGQRPSILFMAMWFGIGAWIVGASSWGLLHREELRLTTRAFEHERRLGPIRRRHAYDRTRVEHLRVSQETASWLDPRAQWRMYGIGGGTIAFDYGDRTLRVAQTEEAEGRRIVEALRQEGLDR